MAELEFGGGQSNLSKGKQEAVFFLWTIDTTQQGLETPSIHARYIGVLRWCNNGSAQQFP